MQTALLLALVAAPGDEPKNQLDVSGIIESETVEIRPRVTGFITKIAVKDGATVKKGDLLAEIDSRLYKIELDRAKAQLVRAEAQVKIAETQIARLEDAVKRGIVSKEELEKAAAEREAAKADVEVAKAGLALAELNLAYTRLTSPIDGRIGRLLTTEGNLVRADETTLVTVVRTDPVYVAFDVPERDFLRLRDSLKDNKAAITLGFGDDKDFPLKATLDFVSPVIDPAKATIRVRAKLANPKGDYLPGMFARVRITPAK
jgi:multidrug efflux system membrane fusion protein